MLKNVRPALRRIFALVAAVITAPAMADGYTTMVISSGLQRPTGIAVNPRGDVFFTQLPTPGVGGANGGSNTVSMRSAMTGMITNITVGEPEPTNIDVTRQGVLYWTCKSANVILMHEDGMTSLVASGLQKPSGIAVRDIGPNRGAIYFTQVPTPGVGGSNGGMNTVNVLAGGTVATISVGEPEPSDIALDVLGNQYWTCKTAGVILKRNRFTSQISVLLSGLNQPTGIATDMIGNLYFTEVPTPGVSGANGGQNKVWRYRLRNGAMTLIDAGDPEPTDVAVSPSGKHVYWTCTSAGVIVRATRD